MFSSGPELESWSNAVRCCRTELIRKLDLVVVIIIGLARLETKKYSGFLV
jgi:hypothetical protein